MPPGLIFKTEQHTVLNLKKFKTIGLKAIYVIILIRLSGEKLFFKLWNPFKVKFTKCNLQELITANEE